jgi:hypothetical protein
VPKAMGTEHQLKPATNCMPCLIGGKPGRPPHWAGHKKSGLERSYMCRVRTRYPRVLTLSALPSLAVGDYLLHASKETQLLLDHLPCSHPLQLQLSLLPLASQLFLCCRHCDTRHRMFTTSQSFGLCLSPCISAPL